MPEKNLISPAVGTWFDHNKHPVHARPFPEMGILGFRIMLPEHERKNEIHRRKTCLYL